MAVFLLSQQLLEVIFALLNFQFVNPCHLLPLNSYKLYIICSLALRNWYYNLGQRQLPQALQQAQQTLPNQLGQATQNPTLRWVFQCFMAVHWVVLNGVKQVVNLTDHHRHIFQFFGSPCRQYYLLC